MRRMIASLVFAIIGTLGVLAQNGTVTPNLLYGL